MPILSLGLGTARAYSRVHVDITYKQEFDSGTGGFAGINAALSNESTRLRVTDDGSGGGYGWVKFDTVVGTLYYYSIEKADSQPGGGHIYFGTSAGNNSLINLDAPSADTYEGSFVAVGTSTYLSLVTDNASRYADWDNIIITN